MTKIKVRYRHTNTTWLKDQGYDIEGEARLYDNQLIDVYNNPRWYLDHCESIAEYKVSWKSYTKGLKGSPTCRHCYVKKKE